MNIGKKNDKQITAVLVGAGHRGMGYAEYAKQNPQKFQVVGVVDPDKARREAACKVHNIPQENTFCSVDELIKGPKIADTVINGTMENFHVSTTLPLLKSGYDVLLEKPITSSKEELLSLLKVAKETGRKVMICHVLRYAPFYAEIRKRISNGELGEILNIQTAEHVSYHHASVGYIRGKWNNKEVCGSSMLLAKCCHDMDLMVWFKSGVSPRSVSSFGGLTYFRPEKAPIGAGTRCLVDCEIEKDCMYSAKKLYLDHPQRWHFYVWNTVDVKDIPSPEEREESLKTTNPHGRCIWKCDNNVVDHQSVAVQFSDGSTATHNMVSGSAQPGRYIHIVGTKGELRGCMEDEFFTITKPDTSSELEPFKEVVKFDVGGDMHGGGDLKLVEDFVNVVNGSENSLSTTSIEDSIYGHLTVYAADEAMETKSIVDVEIL